MQIVIDISEYDYDYLKRHRAYNLISHAENLILMGAILPKGHDRLIDVSDLMPDSDYEDGIFYAVSIGQINGAPTIVEADKAESEETND